MYNKALSALALIVTVSLAGVAPASAAKPLHHHTEHYEFSGVDEFASAVCGVEVMVDLDGFDNVIVNADGTVNVQNRMTIKLTNTTNGKTATMFRAMNLKATGTDTVSEDGILTIHFDEVYNGIPERWLDTNGKPVITDAGRARFVGTIVIDLNTDQLISIDESISTNGPHPILEGGLDHTLFCDLLAD